MASSKKTYIESQKRKRRKLRIKRLIIAGVVCTVGLGGVGFYAFSSRFHIVEVGLMGLERTPREDVDLYLAEWLGQKKWGIIPIRAYWLLSPRSLSAGLASAFPTIENAEITKTFPDTLTIQVKEYAGWGVLCRTTTDGCFWIDRAGVAFEPAPAGFSGIIVPKIIDERDRRVALKERQLSPEMMRLITFFNEKAPSDSNIQSVEFTIARIDETIRIKTRAGWEILVLEKTDPAYVWKNLQAALAGDIKDNVSRLEYIDLRFGNKIFYTYQHEPSGHTIEED